MLEAQAPVVFLGWQYATSNARPRPLWALTSPIAGFPAWAIVTKAVLREAGFNTATLPLPLTQLGQSYQE
jgi:hypothetical protein